MTALDYNRTRTTLVVGLKNLEDQRIWNRFFDSYWKLIYHAAIQAGLKDADAQEVVQETVISVTKNIKDFDYDRSKGSFKGWLMKTTKWKIMDQFRKIQKKNTRECSESSEFLENLSTELPEVEKYWENNWQQELLQSALVKVKEQVKPIYYQVYDMLIRKEMKPKEVSSALGIKTDQVYLAKHRVAEALKEIIDEMNSGWQ
ncbi:MAG: sigma-70 family RNA polymerase sigma factor [Opitutales bacterium]|nr:sigma-70 family RNA polymerase sigma factor [Opitutales bacterium]